MLIISAAMIICIILAHWRGARETELENQRYREEHSLFEDIVVGGRLMQETFLRRDEEGKWELYAAGDFSGRAYIYFTKFQTLKLTRLQEEDGNLSSGEGSTFTLHSGDIIPENCLEDGSVWHAEIPGRKGEIQEQADLTVYCAGQIPTLFINTQSGSLDALNSDQSVREQCSYLVCLPDGSRDCSGRCEIHGRGNSSWKEDKKQYSINLSSERSVLGMESSRKFALIANTSDSSFLRNKITFDLAALCRMPASPQSAFVNVYFNGQYHGLYVFRQAGGSGRQPDGHCGR